MPAGYWWLAPWAQQNSDFFLYVVQCCTNPFICVLNSTAIFCDTGYFVWIEFGRSILTFPHLLSKFWLLLLTLKQSCIHLIFFSLFKLFLISRPVTFHEEWKHFEISCFSHFRNQWHLWSLCPVRVIVVWVGDASFTIYIKMWNMLWNSQWCFERLWCVSFFCSKFAPSIYNSPLCKNGTRLSTENLSLLLHILQGIFWKKNAIATSAASFS